MDLRALQKIGVLSILEEACRANMVAFEDAFIARRRFSASVRARKDAYRALKKHGFSSVEIGRMCGVDHTTVLYALGTLAASQPATAP